MPSLVRFDPEFLFLGNENSEVRGSKLFKPFFLQLLGVVILIIALYLRFDSRATDFVQVNTGLLDEYFVFVYILLLIGLILTLLGFLGCCGAFRESQCMLVSVSFRN